MRPSNHSSLSFDLNIHDVYQSRDLECLRKFLNLLENQPPSTTHQHKKLSTLSHPINRLDGFGRTLIHQLATSKLESQAIDWLRELIIHHQNHPHVTIHANLSDLESGWTPLHRALYHGNLRFAKILISQLGCELNIKDHEGLTAFDLYNLTINDDPIHSVSFTRATYRTDLFTWGSNKNFVLGIHDDGDRNHPERIQLNRTCALKGRVDFNPFISVPVRTVKIGRLHTALITSEGELRVCGFGSGGRLGLTTSSRTTHENHRSQPPVSADTQFTFAPVRSGGLANQNVQSIALGQDHTVVITKLGQVFTFGMNRFGQLGYEPRPQGSPIDDMIQTEPKRVVGLLKKVHVIGAAASRWHTAVFSHDSLYTWGANRGQLGYPQNSLSSIQITPRKVSIAQTSIIQVACMNYETAYLCEGSSEVYVLKSEITIRVVFGFDRFPSNMPVSGMSCPEQGQTTKSTRIVQIDSSDQTLAAVSSLGDVYILDIENPNPLDHSINYGPVSSSPHRSITPQSHPGGLAFKPRRIWTSNKWITAAKHIAVGMDGDVVIATLSGHVYIGSRRSGTIGGHPKCLDTRPTEQLTSTASNIMNKKSYKFQRVLYLQRVSHVSANPTGSFAAIRQDVQPQSIQQAQLEEKSTLASMLATMLFHLKSYATLVPELHQIPQPRSSLSKPTSLSLVNFLQAGYHSSDSEVPLDAEEESSVEQDEDQDDLTWDARVGSALVGLSLNWVEPHNYSLEDGDIFLVAKTGERILVHQLILCSRSAMFKRVISNACVIDGIDSQSNDSRLDVVADDEKEPTRLPRIYFRDHSLLSLLLFVHYLYTDNYPSLWDHRVWTQIEKMLPTRQASAKALFPSIVNSVNEVKIALKKLASTFDLVALNTSMDRFGKSTPESTLLGHLHEILPIPEFKDDPFPESFQIEQRLNSAESISESNLTSSHLLPLSPDLNPDIELELKDNATLSCHSILMRAQCPFFRLMYDQDVWINERKRSIDDQGKRSKIRIEMKHLTSQVMQVVLRHVYTDDDDLFFPKDFQSLNDYVDFVFDVMAAANELMMDKLKFVCSVVLRRCINLSNVTAIAAEADFYRADSLKQTCMNYMIHHVESIFQDQGLIKIPDDLLLELSNYSKSSQAAKFPISRSTDLIDRLMNLHSQYLSELDLPQPKLNLTSRHWKSLNKPLTSSVAATSNSHTYFSEIDGSKSLSDKTAGTPKGLISTYSERFNHASSSSATNNSLLHPASGIRRIHTPESDFPTLNAVSQAGASHSRSPGHGDRKLDNLPPFVMDDFDGAIGASAEVLGKAPLNVSSNGPHGDNSPWATPIKKVTPVDLRAILSTEKRRGSSPNCNCDHPSLGPLRLPSDSMIPSQKLSQREKRRQSTEATKSKPESASSNQNHQAKSPAWRSISNSTHDKNFTVSTPPALPSFKSVSPLSSPLSPSLSGIQPPHKLPHPAAQPASNSSKVSQTVVSSAKSERTSNQTDNGEPKDPASAIGASVITPIRAVGGISSSSSHASRRTLGGQDTPWTNYASSTSAGARYADLSEFSLHQPGYSNEENLNRNSTCPANGGKSVEEEPFLKGNNFLHIQETQAKERIGLNLVRSGKLVPSLIEIQAEENRRMNERKQEEEFLKWFEEESRRVQQAQSQQSKPNRSKKRSGNQKVNHAKQHDNQSHSHSGKNNNSSKWNNPTNSSNGNFLPGKKQNHKSKDERNDGHPPELNTSPGHQENCDLIDRDDPDLSRDHQKPAHHERSVSAKKSNRRTAVDPEITSRKTTETSLRNPTRPYSSSSKPSNQHQHRPPSLDHQRNSSSVRAN